jgi:hypothetical protein
MENVSLNFKEYEPSIANSLEIRFEIVHLPLQFDVIQFLKTKITKTTCKSTSFTYFVVVVNCPKEMSFAKLVRYGYNRNALFVCCKGVFCRFHCCEKASAEVATLCLPYLRLWSAETNKRNSSSYYSILSVCKDTVRKQLVKVLIFSFWFKYSLIKYSVLLKYHKFSNFSALFVRVDLTVSL